MSIINKLKCMIGWHDYRVYGHVKNSIDDIDQLKKDDHELINLTYEYYYECVRCENSFWDYQYVPLSNGNSESEYVPLKEESNQ